MGRRYVAEFTLREFTYAGDRDVETTVCASVGEMRVDHQTTDAEAARAAFDEMVAKASKMIEAAVG